MRIRIASIPQILNRKQKIVCWGAGQIFLRICQQYEESCFFQKVDLLIDQNIGKKNEDYEFHDMRKPVYTAEEAARIVNMDSLLLITCAEYCGILEQAVSDSTWRRMETVVYMLVKQDSIFERNQWMDQCLFLRNQADVKMFDTFLKQLFMIDALDYTKLRFHYYKDGEEAISPDFYLKKATCRLEGEWFLNPLEQYSDEQWHELCRRRNKKDGYWLFSIPENRVKTEWFKRINSMNGLILAILDQKRHINQSELSIFVISHRQFVKPTQNIYRTIYVGGCQGISGNCLTDCTNDNIADLNEKINECTALYWVWKNTKSKYVGFNHYRRYFCNIGYDKSIVITGQNAITLLDHYDILVAQKVIVSEDTLYDQLKNTVQYDAYETGLNIIIQSIQKSQPDYLDDFIKVFQGKFLYPCNMFVTRRDICGQYCEWLFSIIIEAARRIDVAPYDAYSKRIIGFFAERLLTVWLSRQNLKIGELPILMKE